MIHLNTHNMQYPSCIDLHIVYQICFSHHIILYHIQIYYIQISPLKLALEVGGSHFAPNLVQNENHHHKQKQKLVQNGIPHHWTPKKSWTEWQLTPMLEAHPHAVSGPATRASKIQRRIFWSYLKCSEVHPNHIQPPSVWSEHYCKKCAAQLEPDKWTKMAFSVLGFRHLCQCLRSSAWLLHSGKSPSECTWNVLARKKKQEGSKALKLWTNIELKVKSWTKVYVVLPATKRSVGRSSVKPPCPSEPNRAQQPASTVAVPESSGASKNNFHYLNKSTSQTPWTAIWAPTAHIWLRYARIQNWIHADHRQSGCSKSTSQRCGENFVTKSIVRSHSVWHLSWLF